MRDEIDARLRVLLAELGPGREPVAVAGPGRSCPLAYRYRPDDLAGPAAFDCPTLYVVGGLYGNTAALSAILEHAGQEPTPPEIVFNGDFHYFDADPDAFAAIADGVFGHRATLGNVEYALNSPDSGLGCGCDYPDYVCETVVENSNAIVERLRDTARAFPDHLGRLAELPRHLTVEVAGQRVGIVHGDPESLAGWRLALEAMVPGDQAVRERTGWTGPATTAATLADWFRRCQIDVLASTHTGLPYAQDITVDDRPRLVINNGAAGLGNFNDGAYGVLTRISADTRPPPDSLYGRVLGGLRCDAIPVHYDIPRAVTGFLTTWPVGSPAHSSYFDRLRRGTELDLTQAIRLD